MSSEIKADKWSPASGTSATIGDSGDTYTVASGATFNASSSNLANRPNAQPIIINGDMQVAQKATSKTGVTNGDFGIWTCDRWNFTESGTMSAVIDITQESLTSGNAYTDGFSKAYKIDVTTADASLAADDYYRTNYRIEGQDLQLFKKGTANAEKITLAFWVKATKTGTNIVELNDNDNARHCCASYTISTTNTWEKKVLNFPADTTGAWDNDNGQSLRINFILAAGSNYTSGTLDTTWAANTTANIAVGQVNNFDSTSNNVHITGVQLEVGEYTSSTIPPFQHETNGENLLRCQRYFRSYGGGDAFEQISVGYNSTTTQGATFIDYSSPVMRATPTLAVSANGDWKIYSVASGYECNGSMGASDATPRNMKIFTPHGGSATVGNGCMLQADNTTNARLTLSAEL